jgi:hypothetical protein
LCPENDEVDTIETCFARACDDQLESNPHAHHTHTHEHGHGHGHIALTTVQNSSNGGQTGRTVFDKTTGSTVQLPPGWIIM